MTTLLILHGKIEKIGKTKDLMLLKVMKVIIGILINKNKHEKKSIYFNNKHINIVLLHTI